MIYNRSKSTYTNKEVNKDNLDVIYNDIILRHNNRKKK